MSLIDSYGRIASYLRIGVTDKCNLRCRYCMPEEGIDFAHKNELLSYEEIIRLGKSFADLGVNKVRLTGGEPFVRKDIGVLLEELTKIFPKVHITTNASLLSDYIPELKRLRIAGLNISIDSLDRYKFHLITRRDSFITVMSNIKACLEVGIPTKINVVVMKGVNDMEIIDFINFGLKNNVEVRFIEAMPFNEDDGNKDVFMPAKDILAIIQSSFSNITKEVSDKPSSSEHYYISGNYRFGIIPAYSRSLCASCNRIRLTPKGELLTCLYSKTGTDLLSLVRNKSISDNDIQKVILDSLSKKKKDGFEEEADRNEDIFRSMTTIGG